MPGGWLARGQAQALNFTYSRYSYGHIWQILMATAGSPFGQQHTLSFGAVYLTR